MKTNAFLLFAIIICLTGCKKDRANNDIPILDVGRAIDNSKAFDMAEISDKIDFISLEVTSKESLIGNISKMQESENRFYISDGGRNPVRVFDKSGKFVATRGTVGRGPGELPYITGFTADYPRDIIYLSGGSSIISYAADGHAILGNDSIPGTQTAFYDDELVVLQGSRTKISDGRRTLLKVFSSRLQHEADIDITDKGSIEVLIIGNMVVYPMQCMMYGNGNSLFVKETLSDTVFRYENGRALEPEYRLDRGRYFVPAEAFGENPTVKWNNPYHDIADVFDADRWVVVKTMSYSDQFPSLAYLVLDKSNPSVGFSALGSDGKPGLFHDGVKFTPCYIRNNRLVGYMQAIDIVDNAAAITNPDLAALAATLKEDSNPVIVIAKLKK